MEESIKGNLILPRKPQLQILHKQSILDFGVMSADEKKNLKFAIKNCGEEPLDVKFEVIENWVSINPREISGLKKEEIKEIEISARPVDLKPGKQKLELLINSNDLLEKTKKILILAHIQEKEGTIELCPPYIELINIPPNQKSRTKIEVINTSGSSEVASVEVDIPQEASSWLSYEIKNHKNQLYINFKINPTDLTEERYETRVKIRELFSPYSSPLELPLSFTIAEKTNAITSKLKEAHTRENLGDLIKGLLYEEKKNEDNDILYTDQKTYIFKPTVIIATGIIIIIIIFLVIYMIR